MSAGGSSFTPGLKFSTPMISSRNTSFSSGIKQSVGQTKPSTSLTRSSSLKDNSARAETLPVAPRLNAMTTSSVGSTQPDSSGNSAPLFSVEKFVTPVVSLVYVINKLILALVRGFPSTNVQYFGI